MNAYQVPADPTAVMGRRLAAWIIDLVIVYAIFVAFAAATGESTDLGSTFAAEQACEAVNDSAAGDFVCVNVNSTVYLWELDEFLMISGVSLVAHFLNAVVLQGATGGTIGKMLLGIRVIRRDTGAICGFGKAFVRWILWIVDGVCLIGPITALVTKGHRRVGDMGANTLVVGQASVGTVPFVPGLDGPTVSAQPWGAPAAGAGWGAPPAPVPGGSSWGAPEQPAAGTAGWTVGTPPGSDWSAPASAGDFAQPGAEAPAPAAEPHTEQPGVDAPMWDEARGTYIQWDPKLQQWMQWDDTSKQWQAIG